MPWTSPRARVAPADFTLVRARDRDDVVAVLEEAQAHGIPVVPQAARTSLTGAAVATEGCIVLNVEGLTGSTSTTSSRTPSSGPVW